MPKTLRIGIVGMGVMGQTHVRAVLSAARAGWPCRLAGLADHRLCRSAEAPDVPVAPDLGELLKRVEVDAVSICTPTDTHVGLALEAIRAGKHVLVEKPVALRAAEVRRLASAARSAGLVCMPALCMRFWPGWAWLKERIAGGELGALRSATFQRLGAPPDWAAFYHDFARSGGPLFDLHIHDADFIRYALGEPDEVVSTGSAVHITTLYRFGTRGPAHVVAEGGQDLHAGFAFRMRYLVAFEHATADWDLARDPQLLLTRDRRQEPVALPVQTAYELEMRHFVDLATGRVRDPVVTMDDAAATTALLEAEKSSLETRSAVRVCSPESHPA